MAHQFGLGSNFGHMPVQQQGLYSAYNQSHAAPMHNMAPIHRPHVQEVVHREETEIERAHRRESARQMKHLQNNRLLHTITDATRVLLENAASGVVSTPYELIQGLRGAKKRTKAFDRVALGTNRAIQRIVRARNAPVSSGAKKSYKKIASRLKPVV
jgi:hypothetical protein